MGLSNLPNQRNVRCDRFKIIEMVAIISGHHLLSHFDKSQVLCQDLITHFDSLTTYAASDLLEVLRLVTWTRFTCNSAHIVQAK